MNFAQTGKKIVAVGRNYGLHAKELGNSIPSKPILFLKPTSSYLLKGNILLPKDAGAIHHEVMNILKQGGIRGGDWTTR